MDKFYSRDIPLPPGWPVPRPKPAPQPGTDDPVPQPAETQEHVWVKDPAVWVAVVSLAIAIVFLVMYYRNKKLYTF